MKIEMTGLEKLNLDSLELFKNNPRVELKLASEDVEFLLDYAKNREEYNDRSFTEEENKIIRELLDNLFYEYVILNERLGKELRIRKEKLELLITNEQSKMKSLHELGDTFAEDRQDDSNRPSRWDLFVDSRRYRK